MSFDSLLVANRGEIACRVLRTARARGLRTIAVYSDADAQAPHVALADEAVRIGPAPVGESYLDLRRVLAAAARTGAQAIHPGYGFLSENADFARACAEAGVVFVGPPAEAIDAMGDKASAKARMRAAGVPCVPGFDADDPSDAALLAAGPGVGFPLLVKASAGGGGRGMRRVDHIDALPAALRSARAEAAGAFGSGHLLLERLVEGARHVEVQVMADSTGHVIHLGERDCSVQRRHQKVIEEAPSPAVSPALRDEMGAAACAAARAVGYVGAGTVEFLLAADGAFYFLEMNTRLQVEHPVTELVTGLDLVALQLQVATGAPLGLAQADVTLTGHAIEARLYAEAPAAGYAPRTGDIACFSPGAGVGVRIDAGLGPVSTVSPHYDPMIAKIIAGGPDRDTARRRLARALDDTLLVGIDTNRGFLARALRHPVFAAGEATTAFLAEHPALVEAPAAGDERRWVAAAAHLLRRAGTGLRVSHRRPQQVVLDLDGERVEVGLSRDRAGWQLHLAGEATPAAWLPDPALDQDQDQDQDGVADGRLRLGDHQRRVRLFVQGPRTVVQVEGVPVVVGPWDPAPAPAASIAGDGRIRAPSAGRVLEVTVAVGDTVSADQAVLTIEAMKLETTLSAGVSGAVTEVRVAPGEAVATGQVLLLIAPDPDPAPEAPA